MTGSRATLATFALSSLAVLGTAWAYRGILAIGPYNDDYILLAYAQPFRFFGLYNGLFWRPLEGLIAAAALRSFYDLHKVVQLAVFAWTAWGVAYSGRRWFGLTAARASLAAAFLLSAPVAVSSMFQIDTVSQALAGGCVVWLFALLARVRETLACATGGPGGRVTVVTLTGLASLLSLLTKETVLGVYCAMPLAVWLLPGGGRRTRRDLVGLYVPATAALVVFTAVRVALVGLPLSTRSTAIYNPHFGLANVLPNTGMAMVASIFPGNTVDVMTNAMTPSDIAGFGVVGVIGTLGLVALRECWSDRRFWALVVLVLSSCFPHAFGKVSEVYAFQTLPWMVLLATGLATGSWRSGRGAERATRLPAVGAFAIAFACVLGWGSVQSKLDRARATYARSERLRLDMVNRVNDAGCRSLDDSEGPSSPGYYSVFVVRSVELYESLQDYYRTTDACTATVKNYERRNRQRLGS